MWKEHNEKIMLLLDFLVHTYILQDLCGASLPTKRNRYQGACNGKENKLNWISRNTNEMLAVHILVKPPGT